MIRLILPYSANSTAVKFTIAGPVPNIFPTFNFSSVRYTIQFWAIDGFCAYADYSTPQNFNNPIHLNQFCIDVINALNFCYPTFAQINYQNLTGNFLNIDISGPLYGTVPATTGNVSVTLHDNTDHFFSVSSIYY